MIDYKKNYQIFLDNQIVPKNNISLFTVVDRNNYLLDVFLYYYSRFPFDLYFFVRDNSDSGIVEYISKKNKNYNVINVTNYTVAYNHVMYDDGPEFVKFYYETYKKLSKYYPFVLNCDLDELIFADDLVKRINESKHNTVTMGYDLVHNLNCESTLDYNKPIHLQRNYCAITNVFNKKSLWTDTRNIYFQNSGRHHAETMLTPFHTLNISKICSKIVLENNIFTRKHYQNFSTNFTPNSQESVENYLIQYAKERNIEPLPVFIKDKLVEFNI
jgi:hypothetical protein